MEFVNCFFFIILKCREKREKKLFVEGGGQNRVHSLLADQSLLFFS